MTAPVTGPAAQIDELLLNFGANASRMSVNNAYYESNYRPKAVGMAVPPAMKKLLAKMGWARTYLNAVEHRLDVEGFRMLFKSGKVKKDDRLWRWWQANDMDVKSGLAHLEAMIHGEAYVCMSEPRGGDPLTDKTAPVISVESPTDVYAETDPITGRVTRAIRLFDAPNPLGARIRRVMLYLPQGNFSYFEQNGKWVQDWQSLHNLGVCTVVAIQNKERIKQLHGCSEIKTELRSAIDNSARLMMNLSATAELMAVPQRVLFGLDEDEIQKIQGKGGWEAYLANILAFSDPNGKVSQFSAAELRNFAEGMQVLREEASSITGLGPQYFHFGMDNPASAEAMQASEVRLVQLAERKCKVFGNAWENVMRVCLLMMDGSIPEEAFSMETIWADPATPTFTAKAAAVVSLASVQTPDGKQLYPTRMARRKLGMSEEELNEADQLDREMPKARLADLFGQNVTGAPRTVQDQPPAAQEASNVTRSASGTAGPARSGL